MYYVSSSGVLVHNQYDVYQSVVDGVVEYVGITKNFGRRLSEHSRIGRTVEQITGLGDDLTKWGARSIEQALINYFGLPRNGGTLSNVINSTPPTDPNQQDPVQWGLEILQRANYILKEATCRKYGFALAT